MLPDVCYTNLIKSDQLLGPIFNTRKWSKVLEIPRFTAIHDPAYEIYVYMTNLGQYCPTVTPYGDCGLLVCWNGLADLRNRIVVFIFEPGLPIRYRFGIRNGQKPIPIYTMNNTLRLEEMIRIFSEFLDGVIEVEHEPNSGYRVQYGRCQGRDTG